jgi:hypothetical protein
MIVGLVLVCASCTREYAPPVRYAGSFPVRVIDEEGRPIENVWFIGGTTNRVQAPGGLPSENCSDERGYAAPRSWGRPILLTVKDGYEPLVLQVSDLPTNRTLTLVLKKRGSQRKPNTASHGTALPRRP